MKHCVYKHTFPNGKVYIGQTRSGETERRWKKGNGYYGQKVYEAIKEFGWENIQHEIIADLLTQEEADQIEIQLIKYYDATKNGYNVSLGGRNIKDSHYIHMENGLLMHVLQYCGYLNFDEYWKAIGGKRELEDLDYEGMNTAITVIDQVYSSVSGHSFSRNYPSIPVNKCRAMVMLHFAFKMFCTMYRYDQRSDENGNLTDDDYMRLQEETTLISDNARKALYIYK